MATVVATANTNTRSTDPPTRIIIPEGNPASENKASVVNESTIKAGKEDVSAWRIALYYIYVNLSADNQVEEQVSFHRELCEQWDFNGRIRISPEGINAVLSGRYEKLQEYERLVTEKLEHFAQETVDLDLKYCYLREDLPLVSQLFDSLMVKKTQTVISLFDSEPNIKSKRCRKRRAQKQRQEEQLLLEEENPSDGVHPTDIARIQQDMMQRTPSPHLTADEWNEHLLGENKESALLLDVRNVYESRVGHFTAPDVPTLLTNTRKYSDLPHLLATNPHVQEKQDIYMYCTGGVRCERVSMLVQSLYPEKRVYQLQGGIQTYLTSQHTRSAAAGDPTSNGGDQVDDGPDKAHPSTTNLFLGKNFVFDPRRTDPLHGPTAVVGQCLVCSTAHDDYDNGHAPNEQKEARCNTCRMLILVCNTCRPNYACWGEDAVEESSRWPLLYCCLDRCVHEGAAPMPELVAPP
jgi:predicted sulfurtransferase